jgi:hypothetical protein
MAQIRILEHFDVSALFFYLYQGDMDFVYKAIN